MKRITVMQQMNSLTVYFTAVDKVYCVVCVDRFLSCSKQIKPKIAKKSMQMQNRRVSSRFLLQIRRMNNKIRS